MGVKFGYNQINTPPPKKWRNFERAFLIGLAPALALYLNTILTKDADKALASATIVFISGVVKSIGMFLGASDVEVVDNQDNINNQNV